MYMIMNNEKYEVIITKKNNKNKYMRVKEDLKIYVTANKWVSERQIEKVLKSNYDSLLKMINNIKKKNASIEKLTFLGREIDVIGLSTQTKPEIYGNKLYVKDRSKIDLYYKEISYDIFKERLDIVYNKFKENIPYPSLKVRKMKSRWGVCNRKNNTVTLNTELLKKDIKYLDYVIIHELSHFIHFDHSKKFWDVVGYYCPQYKILRKEMKE